MGRMLSRVLAREMPALPISTGLGYLPVEPIRFGRHDKVVAVEISDFVCPPGDGHSPPLRGEPRMVTFSFRELSYTVGKGKGLHKVRKTKRALKLSDSILLYEPPFRYSGMELVDLRVGHMRGIDSARGTLLFRQL